MLRLRTFGAYGLQRADGSAITVQRRPLALLAFVAAAGSDGASREKALGILWSDAEEERARHSLAQTVYALRRSCGVDVIRGTSVLQLDAALITSDLAEFEEAIAAGDVERAAALFVGPFLDGFHLPNAGEFERWLESERADLARRAARAMEASARQAAERNDHRRALERWQRLAALDPLDSRVALAVMQALATSGDVAGAIRHAQVHQSLLRSELDLPPDPAVAGLAEQLRSGASHTTARASAGIVSAAATSSASSSPSERESGDAGIQCSDEAIATSPPAPELRAPVTRRRSRRLRWAVLAIVVAVVAVAGGFLLRPHERLDQRRVVVAAFENHTGDTTFAPLGDMAADWVATELARTGLVDVVDSRAVIGSAASSGARTGAVPQEARMRELARNVGAKVVVWGTYYRRGDTLELHAEITDALDGTLLREVPPIAVPAGTPVAGVRELSSRVMGALATLENPRLAEWAERGGTPPSYEAYREFVDGLEANVQLDYPVALTHYLRARALDTTFLQPLLYAADAELQLGQEARAESALARVALERDRLVPSDRYRLDYQTAELHGDLDKVYQAARAMARVSPGSESYVTAAEAALYVNRPREAVEWLERVNPNEGWVKGFAGYWGWLVGSSDLAGDEDAALRYAREGRRAFPDVLATYEFLAWGLAATGRTAELDAVLDSATSATSSGGTTYGMVLYMSGAEAAAHGYPDEARRLWVRTARYFETHAAAIDSSERDYHARTLLQIGEAARADQIARALVRDHPHAPEFLGTLGTIAAAEGDTATLRAVSDHLVELGNDTREVGVKGAVLLARSRIEAARGNRALAIALLREALATGTGTTYFATHRRPEFRTLATDPAFRELLRPHG